MLCNLLSLTFPISNSVSSFLHTVAFIFRVWWIDWINNVCLPKLGTLTCAGKNILGLCRVHIEWQSPHPESQHAVDQHDIPEALGPGHRLLLCRDTLPE